MPRPTRPDHGAPGWDTYVESVLDDVYAAPAVQIFAYTGPLVTVTGASRFYMPAAGAIVGIRASVGTAPTGASLIVDVNKNGTTVFTTQGNRPTITAAGFTSGRVTNTDVTAFASGDYFTVDIDQVGSTVAGADLTVQVEYAVS